MTAVLRWRFFKGHSLRVARSFENGAMRQNSGETYHDANRHLLRRHLPGLPARRRSLDHRPARQEVPQQPPERPELVRGAARAARRPRLPSDRADLRARHERLPRRQRRLPALRRPRREALLAHSAAHAERAGRRRQQRHAAPGQRQDQEVSASHRLRLN